MKEEANPNNPPAFPYLKGSKIDNTLNPIVCENTVDPGMTLRDYFAGKALQGLVSNSEFYTPDNGTNSTDAALVAYQFADAMLKERMKP